MNARFSVYFASNKQYLKEKNLKFILRSLGFELGLL